MSIINGLFKRSSNNTLTKQPNLTKRIFTGGFEVMGHIKREPDTRTTEQLLENIDYYAAKFPEVLKFRDELKKMNPEHLGLVSDICELASHKEMLNTAINIKRKSSTGKSLFEFLLEKLPQASKENPVSLEFVQTIIDNTDSIASKYALGWFSQIYDLKGAAKHMKAVLPLIGEIADADLQGSYKMDYSKEKNFVTDLVSFISPFVHLDKLEILPEILKIAKNSNSTCYIDAFPFLTNDTPIEHIKKNMETFKEVDTHLKEKTVNLTEFVEKNQNLY